MKYRLRSVRILIPLSIVFCLILLWGVRAEHDNITVHDGFVCGVYHNNSREIIRTWYDTNNDKSYLFLPSYAHLDSIQYLGNIPINIKGRYIEPNGFLPPLELGESCMYYLQSGDISITCELEVLISSAVPTLFITTESGGMSIIHKDKRNRERYSAYIRDNTGSIINFGLKGEIRGRGNASWYFPKKSYLLKNNTSVDLLNMGLAEKWVLLGNGGDTTSVKNKFIYDIASKVGLEWTPQLEYVNLYMNGDYFGLYLLAEKVEFGENRMKRDKCNTLLAHIETASSGTLQTNNDQTVIFDNWGEYSEKVRACFIVQMQVLEDVILSSINGDTKYINKRLDDVLDVSSWARKYLIDEFSGNSDAGYRSNYFYFDIDSRKCYGGPVWDYDASLGKGFRQNHFREQSFIAQNEYIMPDVRIPYYYALMKHPQFKNEVIKTYTDVLRPLICYYQDISFIDSLSAKLEKSVAMDCIRFFDGKYPNYVWLNSYISERVSFLDSAWIEGLDLCNVNYEGPTRSFRCMTVQKGNKLEHLPPPSVYGVHQINWINAETGLPFDINQPVNSDIRLVLKKQTNILDGIKSNMAEFMGVVFMILLFCVLPVLMWNNSKEV